MKEKKHPILLDYQQRQQQVQQQVQQKQLSSIRTTDHPRWMVIRLCQVTVHIVCIVMYLIPILQPNEYGGPTLDESHIMSPDQRDIHDPSTSMKTIFSNDYWGRPMNAPNSHKSWRPLTILSFRYLKSMGGVLSFLSSLVGNHPDSNQLQLSTHRIVNILTHAAAGEMVGILATQLLLFKTTSVPWLLQLIVKLLFCLHPTHVEVTANAANRNHILAVLCSTVLCFPSQHATTSTSSTCASTSTSTTTPIWLFVPTLVAGYLASETFLFQIPAAMVTMVVIAYNNNLQQQQHRKLPLKRVVLIDYIQAVYSQWPRLLLLGSSIGIYYSGRAYFDTLDIPEGLIRPAENPFYHFEGTHRVRNYLYVMALHLHKSWWIVPFLPNPLGFSHEYGYDCIPAIDTWDDERMVSVYVIGLVLLVSLVIAMISLFSKRPHAGTIFGMIAVHWAWMLSLFPISGLVKVGTFVSDRIVVASTVSVSWILGMLLYWYLVECFANNKLPFRPLQGILLGWWIMTSYMTIHHRSLEWMDSISLLNSALETCPRFAKAHMEVSKIHSGLFPSLFNLTKSRYHLEIARDIDPNLCDVHQQFAHVSIQQGRYREYEEELTQAVLCPFTMGGALPMWQRYWQIALESSPPGTLQRTEVEERQTYYTRIIQEAVQEAQRQEEEKTRTR